MATLPGVIKAFSSMSSRSITSTRSGWSWSRVVLRVVVTVTSSASGLSSTETGGVAPAAMDTRTEAGRWPAASTRISHGPGARDRAARPAASVVPRRAPALTVAPARGRPSLRTSTIRVPASGGCAYASEVNTARRQTTTSRIKRPAS